VARPTHGVKGTHVTMAREVIDEILGEGSFLRLARSCGADWSVLLASTWYDVFPLNAVLAQVAEQKNLSLIDLSQTICSRNAKRDLTSVYRAFLRAAGPHLVMNATPVLWRNYVNFADGVKVENVRGRFVGRCTKLPTEVLDWASGAWLGFPSTAIEMSGGKNCKAKLLERGPDGGSDEFSQITVEVTYD